MRKNMAKVLDAFKLGRAAKGDSKATCSTDGEKILSYSTMIAKRLMGGGKRIWLTTKTYSRTTSMQQSAIQYFARENGYTLIESETCP